MRAHKLTGAVGVVMAISLMSLARSAAAEESGENIPDHPMLTDRWYLSAGAMWAESNVTANLNSEDFRIGIGYAFFRAKDKEVGAGLGAHVARLDAGLSTRNFGSERASQTAALPFITVHARSLAVGARNQSSALLGAHRVVSIAGPYGEPLMSQIIDARSDTVTRPTPAMLEAMMSAEVGDDVYGEDETVNALQSKAADLFGMEAALFCPSGTMTNQIGIRVHTRPGDEVICDELSHVYLYEVGGIAANSGASVCLLKGERGRFTAEQVRSRVNSRSDVHAAWSRLVVVENTVNKGGGACWDFAELERIRGVCDERELALHLDGARVFNAIVARNESPRDYGRVFDTISICLSKGLGAPAGSLLLGPRDFIAKAARFRKMMGGGMRQAGYLAAAGLYALEHNVARLRDDHLRAKTLERELQGLAYVSSVLPVETNIVIFTLENHLNTEEFLRTLHSHGIKAGSMGGSTIRFVMHLDIGDEQVSVLVEKLRKLRIA